MVDGEEGKGDRNAVTVFLSIMSECSLVCLDREIIGTLAFNLLCILIKNT